MMRRILIVVMAFTAAMAGCKKGGDDITPPYDPGPATAFDYRGLMISPATINFFSRSTNAASFLWNFGDQTTSTLRDPVKVYTVYGKYNVRLTATSASGISHTASQILMIAPGSVRIIQIEIDTLPFLKPSGIFWDPTGGPDLYCTLVDSTDGSGCIMCSTTDSVRCKLTPSMLPVCWRVSLPLDCSLWNRPLSVNLWDKDDSGADEYIGGTKCFSMNSLLHPSVWQNVISIRNAKGTIAATVYLQWK